MTANSAPAAAPATTADSKVLWESFADFLANAPPGRSYSGDDVTQGESRYFDAPTLRLHCTGECNAEMYFDSDTTAELRRELFTLFAHYICRHCGKVTCSFALMGGPIRDDGFTAITKIGQYPQFGPHVPARVFRLIDDQKDVATFKKGMRAEAHDFGVGAYAYYRRVVENQKDRFFDQIIKVAERDSKPDVAEKLRAAKAKWSFKQGIEDVKDAIPESLKINGFNPLTLLHHALSKGVHEMSDEECLSRAHDVRVVLTEMSNRIAMVNQQDAELVAAANRLNKIK